MSSSPKDHQADAVSDTSPSGEDGDEGGPRSPAAEPAADAEREEQQAEDDEEEEELVEEQGEGIAPVGETGTAPSLFRNLKEYTRSLVSVLSELAHCNDDSIASDIDKLRPYILDEQSYMYTQSLLRSLSRMSHGSRVSGRLVQRIITELDELLGQTPSSQPFIEALRYSGKPTTDLVNAVMKISNGEVQSSDVMQLKSIYAAYKPPSAEYIRVPSFFDALLKDIFKTAGAPNLMDEKIWLLSYASAVKELPNGEVDTADVEPTAMALKSLKLLLKDLTPSSDMKEVLLQLLELSKTPLCCTAELNWIRSIFTDPAFYESDTLTGGIETPPLFDLLDEIAIQFPLQRAFILEIYAENLERGYDTVSPLVALEIKKRYFNQLQTLIKLRFGIQVFNFVIRSAASFDQSLLLHFMKQFIHISEAPYSPAIVVLATTLVSLLDFENCRNDPVIAGFLETCQESRNLDTATRALVSKELTRLRQS
ncbi:TH1 protein-domain-containing protein [Zopfochytrium polystomum]|nr:TH1 protein-domain-containing protein [Zopfochytrium polystomum]